MAITTYAELQTAAANWLVRSDLTSRIPEFITLAEARLNRVMRARRAETEASLTATVGVRTIALPSAYAEALACWLVIDGDRYELNRASPEVMGAVSLYGRPEWFAIDGTNLAFERPCDEAYSVILRYLTKFALSDAVTTNALLTEAPDIYLWATVSEGASYARDGALEARAEGKLTRAIREFNAKDARAKTQQPMTTEIAALVGGHTFDIQRGE